MKFNIRNSSGFNNIFWPMWIQDMPVVYMYTGNIPMNK